MRLYYWIHHTGAYDRNTGVQRVVRNLAIEIAGGEHELIPVRWSAESESVIRAEQRWLDGLARFAGPALPVQPQEAVPIHIASADAGRLEESWLLIPEVPHVADDDAPQLAVAFDYARFHGLRTAVIFFDLVPLRHPGYEQTAPAHELYVRSLVAADVVIAISEDAAHDLRVWWAEQGYEPTELPGVVAAPLAAEIVGVPRIVDAGEPESPIRFTALGTVEPRKNQVEVMRAFERLRARRPDLDVRLDLVGGIHEAVSSPVQEIARRDERIQLHQYVPDEQAHALVAASHATIFMSLYEGFGLPIAESLWLGTPSLCSDHGSMAEIAAGGGCLMARATDTTAIEAALERIADDGDLRRRLTREARTRPLRSWREYADDVLRALAEAPLLRQLVVLEGPRGPVADAPGAGAVRRLHWRTESRALLPGARDAPELPWPGAGQLDGVPAVLRAASARSDDELLEIVEAARGLGLRVALQAEPKTPPEVVARADVSLFATVEGRAAALAEALRALPRTAGVRGRLGVGNGGAVASVDSCEELAAFGRRPRAAARAGLLLGRSDDRTAVQHGGAARHAAARLLTAGARGRSHPREVGRPRGQPRPDLPPGG